MSAARARVVAAACAGAALAYYLYERRRRRRRGWRLSDRLTIILCTSPVKTNPSTALIEEVHGSMRHFAPCLADCPVIVSCDGYKVREKPKYRSGQVTREGGDAYEEFLKRLAKLNLGQIVRCEEREGFGFALKNALRHVRTPYVLVVQHDRNFVRPADVEAVVRCLEANAETVKYVMLPTTTCLHYARLVLSKYRLRIEATRPEGFDFGLMPLLQWYDSTHVCSTRHYRDFVYRGDLVKRGGFVEDKLGQYQLADIRANGLDAHAKYAQFVLDDGVDAPMVSHLDGHDALSFRKFSFIRRDFDAPGDDGARANGDAR